MDDLEELFRMDKLEGLFDEMSFEGNCVLFLNFLCIFIQFNIQ